jgi:hypothetical protein
VALDYPSLKGIPIKRIDTHSLSNEAANVLALSGFTDNGSMESPQRICMFLNMNVNCNETTLQFCKHYAGTAFHDVTNIAIQANYNTVICVSG